MKSLNSRFKFDGLPLYQKLTIKIITRDYCLCSTDFPSFSSSNKVKLSNNIKNAAFQNFNEETQGSTETKMKPKQLKSINYSVLEGHPYEIVDNPNRYEKNRKLYLCKYEGCSKIFKKTWNLVYHFRVHTKEAAYECKYCDRTFIQKANYKRHMSVHDHTPMEQRKKHGCPHCSRKYSCKYNLNAHIKRDHAQSSNASLRRSKNSP
ncbi:unnamed protein product [Moneuplotes crassus]|uniref:C2H2-type domain-containing protein n=1 Tax=Euplotes crassus TaxID=5936 RepID=A0AAD2D236_EUPCR|nr:unnamed protein product [Moneuplotes crassus]